MSETMSDERLAEIRHNLEPEDGLGDDLAREAIELLAEVDRLRAAIANVYEVHVCVAPGARPICDHDGENWPCPTTRAMGHHGQFVWDEA